MSVSGSGPPRRPCAPAAYWFFNHVPTRAEADAQAREIAAAGFAMVMIQARLSLARERYLSPEWLHGYRDAVLAAGAAGLEVGVYDEYNWISGHGGGRTVAGAGELRERHLFWSATAPGGRAAQISQIASEWIDGLGPAGARWIYEDSRRRWDEWEVVAAVAHPDGEIDATHTVEVGAWARVDGGAEGCALSLGDGAPVPDGWAVTFFVAARCASSRLVNYLDPRAAQRFLEVVYAPYLQALDGLVGDPVTCFAFDHPYGGFYGWRERSGDVRCSLLWHPALGDAVRPGAALLALIADVGPQTTRLRCRFFAAYAARMTDGFTGALRGFCDAHGVGLTGHELLAHVGGWALDGPLAEGLDIRASFGGDYFAVDRTRTATLVDASNFAAQLSPIMGDSVARAHGRSRCMVEQYAARRDPPQDFAAGYWEPSLAQLRMQTLRLHVLGMRRLLVHAVGQSDGWADDEALLENPRFDFPPAVNFEPWFGHLAALSAESEAVSEFIEGGEPVREIALVYPLHTLWGHGPGHPHGALFGAWARWLAQRGIGVDVVDDRMLDAAHVRGGRIWIGAHGYRAVILPGVSVVVSARTPAVLGELRAAGGLVVASAPVPAAAADGSAVRWPLGDVDGVPGAVAEDLRRVGDPAGVRLDAGQGTVWRWLGHDRVVLVNDSPGRRAVTLGGPGARRRVELEPGEVTCLMRDAAAGDRRLPGLTPVATLAAGWTFTVGDAGAPVAIDPARGWERQGFPRFSGIGVYRCPLDADVLADASALELPVVHGAASVTLDGADLGSRGWPPYRFALPAGASARAGAHELVVRVAGSAATRYYAGTRWQGEPQPSGLAAAPRLVREVAAA